VQGYMTQERANRHVLLLIFDFYLCALRIAREACGLSTPACHLRQGCSAACVMLLPHGPRCFWCRAIGKIISIVGMTLFFFLFLQKFFNTQGTKQVRIQQWRKLRSSCFPDLPTGRVGEWCEGKRQQQAMTKMGVKVHLCQQQRWDVLCWDCLVSVG